MLKSSKLFKSSSLFWFFLCLWIPNLYISAGDTEPYQSQQALESQSLEKFKQINNSIINDNENDVKCLNNQESELEEKEKETDLVKNDSD